MKKLMSIFLSILMLLTLAASAETEGETVVCTSEASAAGVGLGFEALRMLYDGENNQIVSPVSLAYALAMAAQGAEGKTRQELLDALGAERPEDVAALTESLKEAGLRLANAAFLVNGLVPEEDYVNALREQFGAEWFQDGTADDVNRWVAEQTEGLIDKILDGEFSEDVRLALVNAVAMDAKWSAPFAKENTSDDVFHTPEGDVTVSFMHDERWAEYGERDGVQLLRLSYRDSGLTLLIALPEEGGVDAMLDALCEEGLEYFRFDEEQTRVRLSMPKLDISAGGELNETLKALGVETAFGGEADFSGISAEEALRLSSVMQKARLVFDEDGTKAAAGTLVVAVGMSAINPMDIVDFDMNRPFAAIIADENSGAVCFAGIVANPVEIN